MGVDFLSIDGFECEFPAPNVELTFLVDLLLGAGHPGEEDIGGLVLVCWRGGRPWFAQC